MMPTAIFPSASFTIYVYSTFLRTQMAGRTLILCTAVNKE